MADVLITPASGIIEFKDGSNNVDGKIELLGTGNLQFTSPGGRLLFDDLQLTSTLYDINSSAGTSGQVLISTGVGISWSSSGSGSGLNADTLDGLDSTQFLRSDVADTAAGLITFTAIPAFNGGTSGSTAPFTVDSNTVVTNLNADLLDGIQASNFLRSDVADTKAGTTLFTDTITVDVGNNQVLLHSGATSHPTVIHRNDSASYYILLSAAGTSPSGTWNTLRPFIINLSTGLLTSNNGQSFSGGTVIGGSLELDSTLLDINGQAGTAGQILSSTGTGVDWIDTSSIAVGNADLLDNIDSSRFVYDRGAGQVVTGTSWDVVEPGMYGVASASAFTGTNNPESSISNIYRYGVLSVFEADGAGIAQLYTPHTGNKIALRTGWSNGNWYGWQQVWTSLSDGAGSGLDADTVDGLNPTSANTGSTIVSRDASGNFNASNISLSGNLTVSTGNATGGGIILADDGDIVDLNTGYCAMRFSSGVQIYGGNKSGSAVITLGSNGNISCSSLSPNFTVLAQNAAAGEGGEFLLAKSNVGSLSGNIVFDINGNSLRIFESASAFRGVFVDFTGCGSQSALLHSNNYNSYAPTLTGGGASGTWGINITGSSASTTGNAATATTLQTARTIWGQSFNGSANISGNLTSVGNITGTGAITITAGGTNTSITLTPNGTGTVNAPTFNATSGGFQGIAADSAGSPSFTWTGDLDTGMYRVGTDVIGFTAGGSLITSINLTEMFHRQDLYISNNADTAATSGTTTIDSERLYFRGKYWNGTSSQNGEWSIFNDMDGTGPNSNLTFTWQNLIKLTIDEDGVISAPGSGYFSGSLSGNATTATYLSTTTTLWGQSFNGSANVSGALSGATTITASSDISLGGELNFTTASNKYIDFYTDNDAGALSTVYLRLVNNGSTTFHSGITMTRGGAVTLYHNNSQKLETSSTGVSITGTATATTFSGSGASLTSLNASNLSSGTVPDARISGAYSGFTTINGFNIGGSSGNWYTNIATVASNGVLEIGRYIDFHSSSTTTSDYDGRLEVSGTDNFYFTGILRINTLSSNVTGGRRIISDGPLGIETSNNGLFLDTNGGNLNLQAGAGYLISTSTLNKTTTSAANMRINASGQFLTSSSSLRYKTNIEDVNISYSENIVYNSRPVWFRSTSIVDNPDWSWWGFIAEELDLIDKRLVDYDSDGNPNGVQYDRFTVHLVKVAQEQKKTIDNLNTILEEQSDLISDLQSRLTSLEQIINNSN